EAEVASKQERCILFGLGAVKGVGDSAIDAILAARDKGVEFSSVYNFCEQVDLKRVNRKLMEAMVKSGGFDCFERPRAQLMAVIERALDVGNKTQKDRASGQTSMFAAFAATSAPQGPAAPGNTAEESYP